MTQPEQRAAGSSGLRELMRFLSRGPATVSPGAAAASGHVRLEAGDGRSLTVPGRILRQAVSDGLVGRTGPAAAMTSAGRAWLKRALCSSDPFSGQHSERERATVEVDGAVTEVCLNAAESPLGPLLRIKDRSGRPFLSDEAFRAGERLRVDFERGQLQPRVTANWEASVASGGGRDGGNGIAELTDTALAARLRVERALAAVGPELSGVLVDACCFLKGLETIERERQWPVRSAKLMLKTALTALARHYAPPSRPAARSHRWGAAGYRPELPRED
ncbi:MAG: DUF6456 domain-containing protein [Pararhizobium sp.]